MLSLEEALDRLDVVAVERARQMQPEHREAWLRGVIEAAKDAAGDVIEIMALIAEIRSAPQAAFKPVDVPTCACGCVSEECCCWELAEEEAA